MTKVHYRGFVNYTSNYYVVIVLVSFITTSSVLHVVMSIFESYIKICSLHALVVTHDQGGDTFSLIFYREPLRICETCV